MQTQSKPRRKTEFGIGAAPPRRSVFENYRPETNSNVDVPANGSAPVPATEAAVSTMPDRALASAFAYRFLAAAFESPAPQQWQWLCEESSINALSSVVNILGGASGLANAFNELRTHLRPEAFEQLHSDYVACFGYTVRGACPVNEIEYGDIKADPLFQPHRLADLGAFYSAWGMELAPDAAERLDHISIELEFMSVLAAKEAYGLVHGSGHEEIALCRDARKKFLREHLARWSPAFARRLRKMAGATALGSLADFAREFVLTESARFGVTPGSEDLLLRPVDDEAENLCASCGIKNLPPGASNSPVEE